MTVLAFIMGVTHALFDLLSGASYQQWLAPYAITTTSRATKQREKATAV
jgi:hypothetical protein